MFYFGEPLAHAALLASSIMMFYHLRPPIPVDSRLYVAANISRSSGVADRTLQNFAHLIELDSTSSALSASFSNSGDAPDFVEVGEAGIAMHDAMRRQRRVQLVG
jgi:hypothetical protein